jgi:hypothetical protein
MPRKAATKTQQPAAAVPVVDSPPSPPAAQAKAPSTPTRKASIRATKAAKASAGPQSPQPTKRAEGFSTPTRRKSTAPLAVTPKTKKPATPRTDENAGDLSNVVTSPSQLIKKGAFGQKGQKPSVAHDPKVQKVYKLTHKSTGSLGGNGYDGAIYGELTMGSMQKVVDVLTGICDMTAQSRFIDVGSGLGKPNLHVAQAPGVRISVGIELERIRWQLAMYNLGVILPHMRDYDANSAAAAAAASDEVKLESGVHFFCGDIFDAVTMVSLTLIHYI